MIEWLPGSRLKLTKNQRKPLEMCQILENRDLQPSLYLGPICQMAEDAEPGSKVLSDRNPWFSGASIKFVMSRPTITCSKRKCPAARLTFVCYIDVTLFSQIRPFRVKPLGMLGVQGQV